MRWTLPAVWLIFAAMFSYLGYAHWIESRVGIPPFRLALRAMDRPESGVRGEVWVLGTPIDKPLKDFVKDFNDYLSVQNEASRKANERAALGYFFAAFTALFSMWLTWRGDRHPAHREEVNVAGEEQL